MSRSLTIAVGSPGRASLERSIAGLDGVLSIDLGARSRRIRQTGVLRAAGRAAMNARIEAIAAFLDGRTHTLATADGRVYDNLRMDSFQQARVSTPPDRESSSSTRSCTRNWENQRYAVHS